MSLPHYLQIQPLTGQVHAEIVVPGSKSITNRALILAALAEGRTTLEGALWSEDTHIMVNALQNLGFPIEVEQDLNEPANRRITVEGQGGQIPRSGTRKAPLEIEVGNAGTAARFLAALVCLGEGVYRLDGVARMRERPQSALFQALRQLGYQIDAHHDRLPACIHGSGYRKGICRVEIGQSSQFASALLLCAERAGWIVHVEGEDADESPYVRMTQKLCESFPRKGGTYLVEPDASSGSYFWAARFIQGQALTPVRGIRLTRWPESDWQIDTGFPKYWPLPPVISRQKDLGDSILTAMILAPFATHPVQFIDLGRLRLQECERVSAMRTELTRCGVQVVESGDTLTIYPGQPHGAEIDTYHDHRIAMCFAIMGLKVDGIRLKNPACVKKTFPNFFQKLAAKPPQGLGARLFGADPHHSERELAWDDLLAE